MTAPTADVPQLQPEPGVGRGRFQPAFQLRLSHPGLTPPGQQQGSELQHLLVVIVGHAHIAGEIPAGRRLLPTRQQPLGGAVTLRIRVGVETLLQQRLVFGPLRGRQLPIDKGSLVHPPEPNQRIGPRLLHVFRQRPLGLQGGRLPLRLGKLTEGHQGHHQITAGTEVEHMIAGSPGQDLVLQGQGVSEGGASQRRILGLRRDPQQVDRLVVVEPEPIHRLEQGRILPHQVGSGGTRPQAHRYPIERQHLFTVAGFQRQPLLAGQHLPHGVLGLTGGIDTRLQHGPIATETGLVLSCRLMGQHTVALIAGGEKQAKPTGGIARVTPLQHPVIADRLKVALLVPGGAGHPFQRAVGNGTELAGGAGCQRPLAIPAPQLHGDQIVQHLAVAGLSIEGIQSLRRGVKLPCPGLDDPGFPYAIHSAGKRQQGQERQ